MTLDMKRTLFFLITLLWPLAVMAQGGSDVFGTDARYRVIIDNDFSGDPDGLFQLAHQLLSPSTEICGIVGSHLSPTAGFRNGGNSAEDACEAVRKLLSVMEMEPAFPIVPGAAEGLKDTLTANDSEGAQLIIREVMKDDNRPLFVLCGAGLTNIASAWIMCPEIADRLTVIWIGGQEYEGFNPPPGASWPEYNLGLSVKAGKVVFNRSNLKLWQVPRNVYRQCMYSTAELIADVEPTGKTGKYLVQVLKELFTGLKHWGLNMGETYILGDSPLVTLVSLQTGFEPDPASSQYQLLRSPRINDEGLYENNPSGRLIRVYSTIDTRLMFGDMLAKLRIKG